MSKEQKLVGQAKKDQELIKKAEMDILAKKFISATEALEKQGVRIVDWGCYGGHYSYETETIEAPYKKKWHVTEGISF